MSVESIHLRRESVFDEGYTRLDGLVSFVVDPEHPANGTIADLALVSNRPVRFDADLVLLRPPRPNGRLLFIVANRGRVGAVPFSNAVAPMEISDRIDVGDGWLLKRGYTIAWCGWQWDVERRPGSVGLAAPPADVEPGLVLVQFQPAAKYDEALLSHWPLHPDPDKQPRRHRPYPAIDDGSASLTVRESPDGEREPVPRSRWRFNGEGTRIRLEGGFQPGLIYEAIYRTPLAPVVGCALLAVRDVVSHLRRDADFAFGHGVSQTGRFLRQFMHDGMNADEEGRAVFDGLLPHVAGARRGEFNQRYGQPSVQHASGPGQLPPFDTGELVERAGAPVKVVETNTSSEYWRSDCSLIHTSHAAVRQYMFAGTMHVSGFPAIIHELPLLAGVRAANPLNTVNYGPLLRAAFVNLDRWVSEGTETPPSAVPAPGVAREAVLEKVAGKGVLPDPALLPTVRRADCSTIPATLGEPYESFVSDVDADGNELDGIRLPDVTVPLAMQTGWNPRALEIGGTGQCLDMLGSGIPFERSRIEALYPGGLEDYLAKVRAEGERLVHRRHLLPDDVPLLLRTAERAWKVFTGD